MPPSASPFVPTPAARTHRALGLGCAIPFGLLFALVGLVAFWFITLRPALQSAASAGWVETPCEILSSDLAVNSDSDGSTYRVDIRYRYTWPPANLDVEQGGSILGDAPPTVSRTDASRLHVGDRYDFSTGSANLGVEPMRAVVAAHPPGRHTVCFVDPADPASSVLNRATPTSVWFGAFTLLFPAFGLAFIFIAWKNTRASHSPPGGAATSSSAAALRAAHLSASPHDPDPEAPGEVVLKPASGAVGAFIGITFFALFWNGIIGVIAYQVLGDFGVLGWFAALFLVPFVIAGLILLVASLHAFSRLFAPPMKVRLDPSLLRLGTRVPFSWRLDAAGLRQFTVRLVAREEATYRQGTNTTTAKSDCHRAIVFQSTGILTLTEGRAEFDLPPPATAAPAFAAKNNQLVWELVFKGVLPWHPDVHDRFLLPVRGPAQPTPLAATPEPHPHAGGGLTLWTVDRFAPGETLVFTLARAPAATPGPLTVQLGWFTEGRGTRDAAIEWSEYLPDLAPGADRRFEVRLPAAPWSFAGKLIAVSWRLEVLDARRDPLLGLPLTIAPDGQVIRLPELPPESKISQWKTRLPPRS